MFSAWIEVGRRPRVKGWSRALEKVRSKAMVSLKLTKVNEDGRDRNRGACDSVICPTVTCHGQAGPWLVSSRGVDCTAVACEFNDRLPRLWYWYSIKLSYRTPHLRNLSPLISHDVVSFHTFVLLIL